MSGGREPLILLPAMLTDAALFAHQAAALGRRGPIAVHELAGAETIAGHAAAVVAAAPPRFALAGLSLGGMVAMEIVRRAPERVIRLALLDTNARAPTDAQYATWRGLADRAERDGVRATVRAALLALLLSPAHQDDELAQDVLDMAERVGLDRFRDQLRTQASRIDMRPALSAVRCPTLVATGRQDAMCPPAMHEEIAAAISGASLVIVEDCGHLSSLERPEAVTALLDGWMQAA